MLIIIEGLDRTGKSTLAKALADGLTDAELRHCSRPEVHPLIEYERDLDDYVPGSTRHIIYDRHLWGERVWPTIYRRPTMYTAEMHRHAELYLRSRGALMIYCHADEAGIIERLAGEPYPPADKVGLALDLFESVRVRTELPTLSFELPQLELMKIVAPIEASTLAAQALLMPTSHWVGHPYPSVLLVGERPNIIGHPDAAVPFRPYRNTSGEFLMKAIKNIKRPAITNAIDGSGSPVPLRALWAELNWPSVVALGRTASEALEAATVPHSTVPHPQWVRRFWNGFLKEYGQMIDAATRTRKDYLEEVRREAWTRSMR